MQKKALPFTREQLEQMKACYPTPFYVYDARGIRQALRRLQEVFAWVDGFTNYFAVKALPNPQILRILKEEGSGVDCSSLPELVLAERAGFTGEEILFTSNDTPVAEYRKAREAGALINLDDLSHLDFLETHIGLPDLLCFRYNPGTLREGNSIIGHPEEAKYGLTRPQIFQAYQMASKRGVRRFGLHAMLASNELNPHYFIDTASMLFDLAVEVVRETGVRFAFINLGGGIGIPYRPEQTAMDLSFFAQEVRKLYEEKIVRNGLHPLRIVMECGRVITGPHGYLVTTALHQKQIYKQYIGLDACMANLMRPALYGAYHHITVVGKEAEPLTHVYDVVGSLCENFDKFAIDRQLPQIAIGDTLVIHDAGAHGHAMGFNYNGKLRSAELLLQEDGMAKLVRRAETIEDYLRTLEVDERGA